jgi:hypothetical protein
MAGDWIKVEAVTPDKPEVHEIAEALQIDPETALGHLFRVWIWADQHSLSGDALSVTDVTLDSIARRNGFAQAMRNAGWLKGAGRVSFPNFERHNGKTAKNRALTKDRMKRHRDDVNVTSPSPEKRREEGNYSPLSTSGTSTPENPTPPQEKRARRGTKTAKTELPVDMVVSERVRAWAAKKGFGRLDEHLEAFKAKARKLVLTYADWDAAFEEAVREDWAGLRGKNGNHASGAPASGWKVGAEPTHVLVAAAELLGIEAWREGEETFGQFRARIVACDGGEVLLRGRG